MGRDPHFPRWKSPTADDFAGVDEALRDTQVSHLADRVFPAQSGGEQRRVSLAGVLAQYGPAVLLDEPTNALDTARQQLAMGLCRRLAEKGRAVLAVLYALNPAGAYADEVMVVSQGRAVSLVPPAEALSPERLSELFNQWLIVVPRPQSGKPVVLEAHQATGAESDNVSHDDQTVETGRAAGQPAGKRGGWPGM